MPNARSLAVPAGCRARLADRKKRRIALAGAVIAAVLAGSLTAGAPKASASTGGKSHCHGDRAAEPGRSGDRSGRRPPGAISPHRRSRGRYPRGYRAGARGASGHHRDPGRIGECSGHAGVDGTPYAF
jgi:hypothetical protein